MPDSAKNYWKQYQTGSGGGKSGKAVAAPRQGAPVDPQRLLFRQLGRLATLANQDRNVNTVTGRGAGKQDVLKALSPGGGVYISSGKRFDEASKIVGNALQTGLYQYKPKQVRRLAAKAGLPPLIAKTLEQNAKVARSGGDFVSDFIENDISHAVDYIGRPAQAVAGGLVEGAGNPFSGETWSGAWKGLAGDKKYSPTQALLRTGGLTSKREARKIVESLPGPVKFAAELGTGIVLDPTTWATFGVTAAASAAARSAAPIIAASRGLEGAEAVASVADDIARGAISSAEKAAVTKQLGKGVTRHLGAARGGMRIAGVHVPGTSVGRVTRPLTEPLWGKILDQAAEGRGLAKTLVEGERSFGAPRAAIRQLERAGRAPRGTAVAAENIIAKYTSWQTRAQTLANRVMRKTKGISDDDLVTIYRAMDVGGGEDAINALPDHLRDAARELDKVRQEFTALEREVGYLPTPEAVLASKQGVIDRGFDERIAAAEEKLASPDVTGAAYTRADEKLAALLEEQAAHPGARIIEDPEYLKRYLSEAGAKQKKIEAGLPVGNPFTAKQSVRVPREEATRFTPAEEILTPEGLPKYQLDPRVSTIRRGAESARDVAQLRFTQEMMALTDNAGQPLFRAWSDDLAEAGYDKVTLPVTRAARTEGGARVVPESLAVPKELTQDFKRITKVMSDDVALAHFTKGLDKWMNLWKGYATVPLPFGVGFVLRNMQGNYWNGAVLLGANPKQWYDATKIQQKMWRGGREGDIYKRLAPSERKLVDDAIDNNVIDSGFWQDDLDAGYDYIHPTKKAGLKQRLNPASVEFAPIEYGRRFNSAIERNARFATFKAQRAKGFSAAEAGHLTRKYLFDYGDLTDADRLIKKFVPFWTFTRKNVPLQIEHLLKQPGKYAALQHFRDAAMGESQEFDPLGMPQWMREAGGVVLPDFGVSDDPLALLPDLPVTQAMKTLKPLGDISALIQNKPGAWQDIARDTLNSVGFGGPVGGSLKTLLELGLGRESFTGREFGLGEEVKTPWYLGGDVTGGKIPRELQFLLEGELPGLSKIRSLFPTEEADMDKRTRRIISFLTGQTVYPLSEQARESEMYRRLDEARRAQAALEREGVELGDLPRAKYSSTASDARDYWKQYARR